MSFTREQVLKALSTVMDPDLRKDLVTIGMVEDVHIKGNKISFKSGIDHPCLPAKNS